MITGIHNSHEIFAVNVLTALKILFGASSEACSMIVMTIWRPGFSQKKILSLAERLNTFLDQYKMKALFL